ncbi:MAG: hypothetical protein M0018_04480 [Nitrospiraceae bacterium]|nr:hypothetical protein [Nitrospiraceae bacterium]
MPLIFYSGLSLAAQGNAAAGKTAARVQAGAANTPAAALGEKGPVIITAKSLSADSKTHTAIFSGNVKAKTENMEIFADKMVVMYGDQGGVERIVATGAVRVIKEGRVITAGKADYTRADDKIVFSVNPKVAEGDTVITGTQIVYYVSDDRTSVTDSKVMIQGK